MDKAAQFAPTGKGVHYERRRPEETVLQEHLETFLAVELETGWGLPDFVKDEFDAFLECAVLAYGLVRLRCSDCVHEKLLLPELWRAAHGRDGRSPWSITPSPGCRCGGIMGKF